MAEFNWKSLEQLGEEFKKEAERVVAKLQDPATQARIKEGARAVEAQLRTALGEVSAAAEETLRRVEETLRAQQAAAPGARPPEPKPAAEPAAEAAEPPRARKTVGPRKEKQGGGRGGAGSPARKTVGPRGKPRDTGKM